MGPFCASSALDVRGRFSGLAASIASLLIALLVVSPAAYAKSKPLDAATVHARILKRGVDNPVAVELNGGVELMGRILAISTDSFTMQLFNDPDPVTVNYADVIDLRTGPGRGFWIFTGAAIAAGAGFAIWGFVHVHNLQQQNAIPNLPPMPATR
ncbi:MAG: hypothetical protein ACLGXA_11420 [Acidobacteriota bacterium]